MQFGQGKLVSFHMKESIKKIFKVFRIYHPLQSFYRSIISTVQKAAYRNRYAKYRGSGFQCNGCGSSYEQFVSDLPMPQDADAIKKYDVIAGYGQNIICPNCLSTARERLVLARLEEMNIENKQVLHFSPEKHIHAFLKKQAYVTTADLNPGFYRTVDKQIVKADATGLDLKDAQFDLVIANHILEHIPDDKAAMKEIYRVLKPGGCAILQVPYSEAISTTLESPDINDPSLQSALYGQRDHVRIYALNDYISRLQSAGFEVKKISYPALSYLYKNAIQDKECFLQISRPKA